MRDSTFSSNRGTAVNAEYATTTLSRMTFQDNVAGSMLPGADLRGFDSHLTASECQFVNSRGGTGDTRHSGALIVDGGASCRVLDSTFEDAYSEGNGGAVAVIGGSNAEFIRTKFKRCRASMSGGVAAVKDESTALFYQCDLREAVSDSAGGGILVNTYCFVNITRCTLAYCRALGSAALFVTGAAFIQDSTFEHNGGLVCGGDVSATGAHVEVVRSVFAGARVYACGGSLLVTSAGSATFTDSTFRDIQVVSTTGRVTTGGLISVQSSSRAEFVRCSVSATTSTTSVFQVDEPGSSLSIVDSIIANITQGSVIIDDTTGDEFATQLDLVTFDSSNTIPALQSASTMLVQSCDGLEPSDMSDASVGACATTTQFCMSAACEDVTVGIDCFCFLDGVTPTTEPLPAGCMNSGELAMTVPSSLELRLDVEKPGNVTQEVRAARIRNRESSGSMHERPPTPHTPSPAARRWFSPTLASSRSRGRSRRTVSRAWTSRRLPAPSTRKGPCSSQSRTLRRGHFRVRNLTKGTSHSRRYRACASASRRNCPSA